MEDPLEQHAAPAGGAMADTSLGRVAAVLWKPRETFEAIAARPTWLVALLVILALSALSTALWVPKVDVGELLRAQIASSGRGMDAEQLDQVVEMTSRLRWVMFLGPVLVFQPLVLVVAAAVFYLLFRVLGSEHRYVQSLAVTVHAFVPLAVAALLSIPILVGLESISAEEVMSGGVLASSLVFLAPEDASPAIRALFQSLDFFSLWTAVLLVVGHTRSTRLSNQTVAWCVVALWGVWILARMGLAAVSG